MSSKTSKITQKSPTTNRIVVLGRGAVGKSASTIQFIQSQFMRDYDPTLEDSFNKHCVIDGIPISLDILDTSGQEEFAALKEEYIRRGDGFLIVFSVVDRASFEEVEKYRAAILRVKDRNDFPMVIAGNKTDLQYRDVYREEAKELVQAFGSRFCDYVETSAKTRYNIDSAFQSLVRLIREFKDPHRRPQVTSRHRIRCSIQ